MPASGCPTECEPRRFRLLRHRGGAWRRPAGLVPLPHADPDSVADCNDVCRAVDLAVASARARPRASPPRAGPPGRGRLLGGHDPRRSPCDAARQRSRRSSSTCSRARSRTSRRRTTSRRSRTSTSRTGRRLNASLVAPTRIEGPRARSSTSSEGWGTLRARHGPLHAGGGRRSDGGGHRPRRRAAPDGGGRLGPDQRSRLPRQPHDGRPGAPRRGQRQLPAHRHRRHVVLPERLRTTRTTTGSRRRTSSTRRRTRPSARAPTTCTGPRATRTSTACWTCPTRWARPGNTTASTTCSPGTSGRRTRWCCSPSCRWTRRRSTRSF